MIKWETIQDSPFLADWKALFLSTFRAVRETRLQALQFKVFYRIIPCRLYLKTIRVLDLDRCGFCPQVDSIQHFLMECPSTRDLWNKVATWLRKAGGLDLTALSPEEILLGTLLPAKSAPMLNFIALFTKAYIHRQKLFYTGELSLLGLLGELKKKLRIEQLICRLEGRYRRFTKWERVFQALG